MCGELVSLVLSFFTSEKTEDWKLEIVSPKVHSFYSYGVSTLGKKLNRQSLPLKDLPVCLFLWPVSSGLKDGRCG